MPWPDDMFAPPGSASPGSLDTYGLGGEDDYSSTLAAIDAQLRGEVPAAVAPEAPADPNEIEMPVDYVGKPTIGKPHVPEEPPPFGVPGIGVPAPIFDAAAGDPREIDIDAKIAGSADRQLDRPVEDVKPDYEATPLDLPTEQERSEALQKMSPAEFAQLELKRELARRDQEATAVLEANRVEREQAERDHEIAKQAQVIRQQEAAAIQADAKRLAEEKIDPEGWQKSRSVPQSIAGFLSVVIGGFGGGPNVGLQMINSAIEQNIEAQRANLANKRAALGDRRSALADQQQSDAAFERQANAYRIATYERTIRDISAQQMQYDPQGTTAIALEKARRAIIAEQAKAYTNAVDAATKRQVDALKTQFDLRKTAAETAKLEAEAAKLRGAGAGAGAKKDEDIVRTPAEWAALGVTGVPAPMSMKELKKLQPLIKGGQEVAKNEQQIAENQRAGLSKEQRELGIPGVTMADGSELIARGGTEEAKMLRKKVAATRSVVRLLDEVERIRTGWTSDTVQSPEWQQLQSDWNTAIGVAKDVFGLGALSGPDLDLINKVLGAKDPTQFRDIGAGIAKARQNMINITADELDGAGLDKRWTIPKPKLEKPKETATDTTQKRALSSNVGSFDAFTTDLDTLPRDQRPDGSDDAFAYYTAHAVGPEAAKTWIPPGVRRHIDALASQARTGDEKAHAMLGELAQKGGSPAVRAAAQVALTSVASPSDTVDLAGSREVARDTIAEPPKGKK